MPYTTPVRHPGLENPRPRVARRWTPNYAETTAGTASRRIAPRAWKTALHAAYQAKLIPGATETTLAVADDLAPRMDFGTGHVRYCWATVMQNTSLSRATVARHIRVLREAGWLAWAEHGTRANSRAAKGEDGYAGTATVYAATVPPVYDRHVGNRVHGSGYGARVVGVTSTGREDRIREAMERADAKAGDTPSLRVVKEDGSVQVEGGSSTTAQARPSKSGTRKTTVLGKRVTRRMADAAERIARYVRPLVGWTQTASLRQLSWVLLDLADRGWDEMRIVVWLREQVARMREGWRPVRPHRFIAACLRAEETLARELAARMAPAPAPTVSPVRLTVVPAAGDVEAQGEDWAPSAADQDDMETERLRILLAARMGSVEDVAEAQGQVRMWALLLGEDAAREAFGEFAAECLAVAVC